jgi:alpha-galactosidase/6-phospho-beta-glucosidase family protein
MVNVVIENGELFGKDRAKLRNEQLLALVKDWERQRDVLMDEIAFRKGQMELLEELVKQSYEKIVDVNKEEKQKETDKIDARMEELKEEEKDEEEEKRQKEARAKHKKKQAAVKAGKVKGKAHPSDRGSDLSNRKAEAKKKKKGKG